MTAFEAVVVAKQKGQFVSVEHCGAPDRIKVPGFDPRIVERFLQLTQSGIHRHRDDIGLLRCILPALRISAGVRVASRSQLGCRRRAGADPVVVEAAEPERHPLDPLDQVVDRFGRAVGHVGAVPGDDLVSPPAERAAEGAHLERHLGVRRSRTSSSTNSAARVGRCGRRWTRTTSLACQATAPRRWGSPAASRPSSLVSAVDVEAFVGHGEQAAAPVERIVLAAPMAERLVLHPAATLVETPGSPGARRGTGRRPGRRRGASCRTPTCRAGQIQGRPGDPGPPRSRSGGEPGARPRRVTTRHDVESCPAHIDDLGRPRAGGRAVHGRTRSRPDPSAFTVPKRAGSSISGRPKRRRRPSRCASRSSSRARPRTPSGRDGRPAGSPTVRPGRSRPAGARRCPQSIGRSRSTTQHHESRRSQLPRPPPSQATKSASSCDETNDTTGLNREAVTVLLTNDQAALLDELGAVVHRRTGRALSRSAMIRATIAGVSPEHHELLLHTSEGEIAQAIGRRLRIGCQLPGLSNAAMSPCTSCSTAAGSIRGATLLMYCQFTT